MSTHAILSSHVECGNLTRFEPMMFEGEVEKRRIVMRPSLRDWIAQSPRKTKFRPQINIRQHLGVFVRGGRVDNEDFMKELNPVGKGFWEFRIRISPQERVFGVFVMPNCFFATHRMPRKGLDFEKAINRIKSEWFSLFPGMSWFVGTQFDHYVTHNGDDRHVD